MKWRHAASIGPLLNNKGQSDPDRRDAAVFVSLLIPDTSVGVRCLVIGSDWGL